MKLWLFVCVIMLFDLSSAQISDFKTTDFTVADNTAKLNYGHELDNLPILAHKLTHKLDSDVEKFRAIYLWVCENISVDSNQGNKVLNKRRKLKSDSIAYKSWNDNYLNNSFKRLKKQKKQCAQVLLTLSKNFVF